MATLNVRPGLSAPLVNSIPSTWDPQWFRRWITDFLNAEQINSVSQILGGAGISIAPAGGTGIVTVTATGGGGSANITADTHPTTPTPWDDEFEFGTSLDTTGARFPGANPWTILSQIGIFSPTINGSLSFYVGSGLNLSAVVQPVPTSSTWEFTAKIAAAGLSSGGGWIALIVRNSANNNELICVNIPASYLLIQQQITSYAPPSQTFVSAPQAIDHTAYLGAWTQPLYLQVFYDGTNIGHRVSTTGIPGSFSVLTSETVASFLGAVTHVGLYSNSVVTAGIGLPNCDWFRRTA